MTATNGLRVGILGAGRIGRMHAELIANRVDGLDLALVHDVNGDAAAEVGGRLGVGHTTDATQCSAPTTSTPSRSARSTDTHVPLMIEAARRARRSSARSRSHSTSRRRRGTRRRERAGVPIQVGFNRRFDPAHRSVRDAVAGGDRRRPPRAHHQPRPGAAADRVHRASSGGIFLDMTIHDFDMARYVTGSEVVEVYAQGAVRVDPAIGEAGDSTRPPSCCATRTAASPTIDNSRQAVYGYDQRVEAFGSGGMAASDNPLAHTGVRRTATGTSAPCCRSSSSTATSRRTLRSGTRSATTSTAAVRRR